MTIKVGLTGGIGAGKSTVAKVFEKLGVPVYVADSKARELQSSDAQLIQEIKEVFGEDIYVNGDLDRPKLARIVFNDKGKLDKLNKMVHPAVRRDLLQWMQKHKTAPYVIEEAAILFESGAYKEMDKIITVSAPEEIRVNRVVERDGVKPEEVRSRMSNQWEEREKVELSDFVIQNDDNTLVIPQVLNIHKTLTELAKT